MGKGYKPEVYRQRNDKYTYEKCSTSLNNKEVWGEARSSYFSPTRVAKFFLPFFKIQNWQRCREAGTFHHTGDGKVNWCNIFEGQFDNIYKKM